MDSGGSPAHFAANVVREALEQGLQTAYLAGLRGTYRRRLAAMDAALARHLPAAAYVRPGGGFFFWARLPGAADTAVLRQRAAAHQVGFQPGARFSGHGRFRRYVRLSFAFYGEAQIEQGIKRLSRLVAAGENTGE
jgi:2-aminoadipate transaminase